MAFPVSEKAHAKINLFLHITGKREDGYHNIFSLVSFIDLADTLALTPCKEKVPQIILSGDFASTLSTLSCDDNIAMKAAKRLSQYLGYDIDFDIHIEKNIPPGAGLGGGSTNAAAIIRMLLRHWSAEIPSDTLSEILLSLGADVPICYVQKPVFMEGIGEIISESPLLPQLPMIVVYPNLISNTGSVYQQLSFDKTDKPAANKTFSEHSFIDYLTQTKNDLTSPACRITPEISSVLEVITAQQGSLLSRMSGSGSACFGIYETQGHAIQAVQNINAAYPHWWCQLCNLKK